MDVVLQRLARREEDNNVLEHVPWERERGGGAKLGPAKEAHEGVAGEALDGNDEEAIEECQTQDAGELAPVARWETGAAAMFDGLGDGGEGDVKEQRHQGRQQPEDGTDGEDADEVDLERRVGEDERRPGHVEEENVEAGGP